MYLFIHLVHYLNVLGVLHQFRTFQFNMLNATLTKVASIKCYECSELQRQEKTMITIERKGNHFHCSPLTKTMTQLCTHTFYYFILFLCVSSQPILFFFIPSLLRQHCVYPSKDYIINLHLCLLTCIRTPKSTQNRNSMVSTVKAHMHLLPSLSHLYPVVL